MIQYKTIMRFCFAMLPNGIKKEIQRKHDEKKLKKQAELFKTKICKEEIDGTFDKLDLQNDVIIHSSLGDLGRIEGNLKPIVGRINCDVIERGHTVLCPAIPVKGSTLEYMKSINEFDAYTAPNAMGAMSRYYQKLEHSKRSLSPSHSVVAYGGGSEDYTEDHHLDITPFAAHSPYLKLVLAKGKVLLFGAQMKSLTICHVVEDMLGDDYPVKVYGKKTLKIKVSRGDEFSYDGVFNSHSKWSGILRDVDILPSSFVRLKSTIQIPLGRGMVTLLDARDITVCQLELLKKGITPYGHRKVSDNCIKKADEWITRLNSL